MSALDSHAKTHLLSCELMLDDGEVCTCFRDQAASELAERDAAVEELTRRREEFETMLQRLIATEAERDALRAVVEAARKFAALSLSNEYCLNCLRKISNGHEDGCELAELAAALARVDGKGEK